MSAETLPVLKWALVSAILLVAVVPSSSQETNRYDVQVLLKRHLPDCQYPSNAEGKHEALVSPTGEVYDLSSKGRCNPTPIEGAYGYWSSPTMRFLSEQKPQAATAQEAIGVVQLMHVLCFEPGVVGQKLYSAHTIKGGWVIQVEHDFSNYPGKVIVIHPYELLVDDRKRLTGIRQRWHGFVGDSVTYTNIVISVTESEIRRNGGRDAHLRIEEALHDALEREREHKPPRFFPDLKVTPGAPPFPRARE